jgi:hypothetical protein
MNDFDDVDAVVDVFVEFDVDDDDDDDEVMQNHCLHMEYHQKMMLVAVQMDQMVLLKPLIMVGHYNVVNNTYHYSHHPTENYPFDNIVVESNLEIRRKEKEKES